MKPTVFNYQEYERVVEENKKLNAEVADLRIRCRIADGDKRDCKSCKHQKSDGCSRWNCEYEPRMDDIISRQDAIEAIASRDETDGTVKVFTGREVNEILSELPSEDEQDDNRLYIKIYANDEPSRKVEKLYQICGETESQEVAQWLKEYFPSADRPTGWIPVGERLPEDIKPVIITWKNTDPAPYYQYIVGKHFIGTGHYCNGKWFWYSGVCEDLLAEYGESDLDELDEAIEVIAWMPLPEPYREEREEYELATEQMEHDTMYEPTYNSEDGSM